VETFRISAAKTLPNSLGRRTNYAFYESGGFSPQRREMKGPGDEFRLRVELEQAYVDSSRPISIRPPSLFIVSFPTATWVLCGQKRMPRVTSLPSPAVVELRPQPTLHRPPPAPFSFRQAQLLYQVPARLLGTLCILSHPWEVVKSQFSTLVTRHLSAYV
jgi:hypothetical protein